ncbi:MAG: hypothetical protein JSV91_08685 [Phycisphaerales bacterium]|nr:MAG: hypothetical protein JSV91_08685 [Phycisphaerales bacterium]
MRVFLDQQLCEIEAGTVGEAVVAGAAAAEKQGRMVVEVTVDGSRWTDEQIASAGNSPLAAEEVRLQTAVPARLVAQVLKDAGAVLAEAESLQREAAEFIESDQRKEAMERLNEALTIWVNVQQAVAMSAEIMSWNLDAEEAGPTSPAAIIAGLNDQLRLIRNALEVEDPIGLSDSLRYDLPEVIGQWRQLLGDLVGRAEKGDVVQ